MMRALPSSRDSFVSCLSDQGSEAPVGSGASVAWWGACLSVSVHFLCRALVCHSGRQPDGVCFCFIGRHAACPHCLCCFSIVTIGLCVFAGVFDSSALPGLASIATHDELSVEVQLCPTRAPITVPQPRLMAQQAAVSVKMATCGHSKQPPAPAMGHMLLAVRCMKCTAALI